MVGLDSLVVQLKVIRRGNRAGDRARECRVRFDFPPEATKGVRGEGAGHGKSVAGVIFGLM